jgi:hypothetical protein
MSPESHPQVIVKTVTSENGDMNHCLVMVGGATFEAHFNQSSTALRDMVLDATGVSLSVEEMMMVTRASRSQMEREAERLKQALIGMPRGTVATLRDGLYFWIDGRGNLLWVEWVEPGCSDAKEVTPGFITCIGEIDTEELFAVAEAIRIWFQSPSTIHVDTTWLELAESSLQTSSPGKHRGQHISARNGQTTQARHCRAEAVEGRGKSCP